MYFMSALSEYSPFPYTANNKTVITKILKSKHNNCHYFLQNIQVRFFSVVLYFLHTNPC